MRRYTVRVLLLAVAFLFLFGAIRLAMGNTYRSVIPFHPLSADDPLPAVETDSPDVIRVENLSPENDRLYFDLVPLKRGRAFVVFRDSGGNTLENLAIVVDPFFTVFIQDNGSFNGDLPLMILLTLFFLITGGMMLHAFRSARGADFYAYSTIFYIGFFLFVTLIGIMMLNITLRHIVRFDEYSMLSVYYTICGAANRFMFLTSPLLLVFSVAMAVSNIVLLRHNRPRIQNALALLISLLIVAGAAFGFWLTNRDFSGSLLEYRLNATIENVYCTVYVYFECILAGAIICGIKAARHQPPADRDVIVILGCWFRKDGSLPPLLRGRVDRAIEYWKKHREETGRDAFLIPSGGKGRDESMPEAEAMKAYLVAQGIPENLILPETRSANTFQNMQFSRKIMEENHLPGEAVFATTNYHVFRSGLWAAKAGLKAEGVGSKTKWWFWPNAFVRECIGLVANRWKQELILLLGLVALFSLLSMTLLG